MPAIGDGGATVFDLVVERAAARARSPTGSWRAGATPAGLDAYEALRVEARRPRFGVDTDHRTIPNELPWLATAVHLDKGCYRGQETVARVHNLGRPPRRFVLLHLDGVSEVLAEPGTPVLAGAREVGRVGTVVRHYELGVIALALVKRSVSGDAALTVAGSTASIDPDDLAEDDRRRRGPRAHPRGPVCHDRPVTPATLITVAPTGAESAKADVPGAAGHRRGGRRHRAGLPGRGRVRRPPAHPRRRDEADARPAAGRRGGRRGAREHRPDRAAVDRRGGHRPVRRAPRRPRRAAGRRVPVAGHGELRPRRLQQPLGPDRRAAHPDAAARHRARVRGVRPRPPGHAHPSARQVRAAARRARARRPRHGRARRHAGDDAGAGRLPAARPARCHLRRDRRRADVAAGDARRAVGRRSPAGGHGGHAHLRSGRAGARQRPVGRPRRRSRPDRPAPAHEYRRRPQPAGHQARSPPRRATVVDEPTKPSRPPAAPPSTSCSTRRSSRARCIGR